MSLLDSQKVEKLMAEAQANKVQGNLLEAKIILKKVIIKIILFWTQTRII